MKIDGETYFKIVRPTLFGGSMKQAQVDGQNVLLAAWDRYGDDDPCKLAYLLATVYHETAKTMQPIAEYGKGKGRKYGVPDPGTGKVYYGRGFVQLTWIDNYRKAGKKLNVDLVGNPDLAMEPDIAARIAVIGMMQGWFTGKKLGDYFNASMTDWNNARRIINGTDRAATIGGYARQFHAAILAALDAKSVAPTDIVPAPPPPPAPATKSTTTWIGVAGAAAPAALATAKQVSDYANSTVVQIKDTAGQVKDTVTIIRDNADTVSGLFTWIFSPPVTIGLGVISICAIGYIIWRHVTAAGEAEQA